MAKRNGALWLLFVLVMAISCGIGFSIAEVNADANPPQCNCSYRCPYGSHPCLNPQAPPATCANATGHWNPTLEVCEWNPPSLNCTLCESF